ncbi:hypothetical protein NDU88_000783 [Pleurodeles waltl]|uniref:LSM domain-containing protein n=1 Tax=Pleurodeles waltl TaxID=8319 RepID=A0AAV7WMD0_PLEWA|nr:hypothetical protein NDU88_000783 [Pleurodeles waltl]
MARDAANADGPSARDMEPPTTLELKQLILEGNRVIRVKIDGVVITVPLLCQDMDKMRDREKELGTKANDTEETLGAHVQQLGDQEHSYKCRSPNYQIWKIDHDVIMFVTGSARRDRDSANGTIPVDLAADRPAAIRGPRGCTARQGSQDTRQETVAEGTTKTDYDQNAEVQGQIENPHCGFHARHSGI